VFLEITTSVWLWFGLCFVVRLVFGVFVEVEAWAYSTTCWLCVRATAGGGGRCIYICTYVFHV
jgi:hypothetical protein